MVGDPPIQRKGFLAPQERSLTLITFVKGVGMPYYQEGCDLWAIFERDERVWRGRENADGEDALSHDARVIRAYGEFLTHVAPLPKVDCTRQQ